MMRTANQWLVLAGFILICFIAGGLGGFATSQSVIDWYPTLNKPSWNPPPWIFGPVWSTLYLMMAAAAWLVWKKDRRFSGVKVALVLFFIQLALNCLWPFLFFKFHNPAGALVDIIALLIALALTTWAFFTQSKLAGSLMVPYLAWVSFATLLNFTIWQLN
jgi:translocator protein